MDFDFNDFTPASDAVREVVEADTLPDYRMILDDTDKVTFYVKNPRRLSAGIAKTVTA